MFEQLQKLKGVARLRRYIDYLETKHIYSAEEQAAIEELFEED